MGLYQYDTSRIERSERIPKLIEHLFEGIPTIESARAKLITESYQQTESEPIIIRRAKAFEHILKYLPIIIRSEELIVGSTTIAPRGCQTYPEFSYEWLEAEFETVATRSADPFYISEETKRDLREVHPYWKGKTTSELATQYMEPEALTAMAHGVFNTGNYFYNGIGHVTVAYDKVMAIGYEGIKQEAEEELKSCDISDGDYAQKSRFLKAVMISCDAIITYANRYADLAQEEASKCPDASRKAELLQIAANCHNVPAKGASSFYEACQSFWFIQQVLQIESSGHSISPGRIDQYLYPYYEADRKAGILTKEFAQELLDCIWVKLNDLNKCRDEVSAVGFAGYSLFQNLIVGGQNEEGIDATNDLSFMAIEATMHVQLPMPSFSVRVWNGTPHDFMIRAAELTRMGLGLPAYYNDEVVITSLMNRGLTLAEARDYSIIGCVEPQKPGKTDGWHDAAFFNMCKPLEFVFSRGEDGGEQVGVNTPAVETMKTFEDFFDAYKKQMNHGIKLLVNANNAIDKAHAVRCPLPFLSCMIDDCMERGISVQEGGAVYNFTGPQGFGIANMTDSLYAIRELIYNKKLVSMADMKKVLAWNYGRGLRPVDVENMTVQIAKQMGVDGKANAGSEIATILKTVIQESTNPEIKALGDKILDLIADIPKYGNDDMVIDAFAREVAYTYTKELEQYHNPRGGTFQAGLYPVSANVPMGEQTGATPDGRLAGVPVADGVSPTAGKDTHGPTAAANSVASLDHFIASNGTLFNQKFHPSALSGREGLENFVALIRSYFDAKGSHMQFNVVSRETLLDAQAHPEEYKQLVVRVAGYSALFTTLSKSLQDDIINRTEQGF